jgi:hypothetical protein
MTTTDRPAGNPAGRWREIRRGQEWTFVDIHGHSRRGVCQNRLRKLIFAGELKKLPTRIQYTPQEGHLSGIRRGFGGFFASRRDFRREMTPTSPASSPRGPR